MSPSRFSLFDFEISSRFTTQLHRPLVRIILLSISLCSALWFVSIITYHPPGAQYHRYPHGHLLSSPSTLSLWSARADQVKEAYLHAYNGYIAYAGEHDELLPITKGHIDNLNGWKLTLIDSLDTMWIMGLHDEFEDSLSVIANLNFTQGEDPYAAFFETVIRYLGGLLSAYALSGEGILFRKADELGMLLLPAFNTTSGLPMYAVNTVNGKTRPGWHGAMLLSESLSCQMEFKYLAHLTGRTQYFDKVERVMTLMQEAHSTNGLLTTSWDITSGLPLNDHYTVGAFADSAYEYLLKQYLLTGKTETKARDLYIRSATGIINNLLYLSPQRKLLYVTEVGNNVVTHVFEHLSCFLPGLLALGVHSLGPDELSSEQRQLHIWAAEGLANTCWLTYLDTKTGLGPDEVVFPATAPEGQPAVRWVDALKAWKGGDGVPPGVGDGVRQEHEEDRDYRSKNSKYILRPETVETFYIMWRITGDEKWRERGWAVFLAIEKETRTEIGYASIESVDESPAVLKDEMPSFFLAETLKYLYLLFTDEEIIPLDRWVFNTEAHPLPIFIWSDWQKKAQHIPI